MTATTITPPKMKAFLAHVSACGKCQETKDNVNLCQDGYPLLLRWSSEAEVRNETEGAETDPHRALHAMRYFAKGFEPGDVVLPKATALAVCEYVTALQAEAARLAMSQCKHDVTRPQCQVCAALCPICPLPTDIPDPPEVTT